MKKGFFIFLLLPSLNVSAITGMETLETQLAQKNPELQALKHQVEAKEKLYSSGRSVFYPTLNAVGGWAQNKTDELAATQKGYVGYLEGRFNLFNGFKDHSSLRQREIELKLSKIELESKQRELRLTLTEVASDMILLHSLQNILDEEDDATKIQSKMAEKKVAAGLTGSVDNLEFNLRESEIQIEKNRIDQLHNEAHQKLIQLYGEDLAESHFAKLSFSGIDELVNQPKKLKLEDNLEYQISDLNLTRAHYEKSVIKSDFSPKLDFLFNVGRLTPSENTPISYNESKYALILTVPLFSGFDTYYKTKSASLQIASSEKLKTQKTNDVQSTYANLKTKVAELHQLYKINESKLINSQKYFDLTLGEYKRGIKNSPDLVSATERLFGAKKKKFEILKELELLKVKMDNI